MALEIIVTTGVTDKNELTLPNGRQVFTFLGPEQPKVTVQVNELLSKVFDEIRQTVDFECQAEVVLSGSLTLAGSGEAKFLLYNISGEAEAQASMTVKVGTVIKSKVKTESN